MQTAAAPKSIAEDSREQLTWETGPGHDGGSTEVSLRQGLACEIVDGDWRLTADLPSAAGGGDRGPDPGVLLRAALGSCLAMDIVTWASVLEVPLDEVKVIVQSQLEARGNLGLALVPAGSSELFLDIQVESSAPRGRIEAVIETAAQHNPRLYDLCNPIPVRRRVTVRPPAIAVVAQGPSATIRPAVREDSAAIARYFLISSDGLADYIWSRIEMPGHSAAQVGAARYARQGVAFSYENCQVVERDGAVVGMMHCFPIEVSGETEEETDPVLRPYAELEDPGSLYISGLAIDPALRGQGLGTMLLQMAEAWAQTLGLPRLSLICFERNADALRLYERQGYRATLRRPLVPHPSLHYRDGDAILMVKTLDEDQVQGL